MINISDTVKVGRFMWINDDDIIGFDEDAKHGQGLKDGGSIDIGCTVDVRHIEGDRAVVRLNRPETPYGAPAPIGIVFWISVQEIESWSGMLDKQKAKEKLRAAEQKRFCR